MAAPVPDHRQTEEALRERIASGSQDPGDYLALADLLGETGHEALALYQRALDLPLPAIQRAEVCVELAWYLRNAFAADEKAQRLAQEAMALSADERDSVRGLYVSARSNSLLAYCTWKTENDLAVEKAQQALELWGRLVAKDTNWQTLNQAYLQSAELQRMLGNVEESISLCDKALKGNLDDRDRLACLLTRSLGLQSLGRTREAEEVLQGALSFLRADPGSAPRLYFELGLLQRSQMRPVEAMNSFRRALQELRNHPTLHVDLGFLAEISQNIGELAYEEKRYSEAASAFDECLACLQVNSPERSNTLLWRGYCHVRARNYGSARECFEQVAASSLTLDADRAAALEALAALPSG